VKQRFLADQFSFFYFSLIFFLFFFEITYISCTVQYGDAEFPQQEEKHAFG